MAERVRFEIGFDGGQALSLLVDAKAAAALEEALAGAGESAVLESEDGTYTVALRKVTYVKRFTRESRVGFTNT